VTTIIKKRVDLKKTVNNESERVEFYTRARAQKTNKRKYLFYIIILFMINVVIFFLFFNIAVIDDYSGSTAELTGVRLIIFRRIDSTNLTDRIIYYYWNSEHLRHIFGVSITSEKVKADNGTHIAFYRNYFNQTTKEWCKYLSWKSKAIVAGEFTGEILLPYPG